MEQRDITFDKLTLRNNLGIGRNLQFGFEIEAGYPHGTSLEKLVEEIYIPNWFVTTEGSIHKSLGVEYSSDVLFDDDINWKYLQMVADSLSRTEARFDEASFQVNMDNPLTDKQVLNMLKIMAAYEDVIYSFSRGENDCIRKNVCDFAGSIVDLFHKNSTRHERIIEKLRYTKEYALSLKEKEGQRILELRTPNGTFNPILWQNYTSLLANLIKTTYKSKYDKELINYMVENSDIVCCYNFYNTIDEERALEFANLIFDNDTDITYFMTQYLNDKRMTLHR